MGSQAATIRIKLHLGNTEHRPLATRSWGSLSFPPSTTPSPSTSLSYSVDPFTSLNAASPIASHFPRFANCFPSSAPYLTPLHSSKPQTPVTSSWNLSVCLSHTVSLTGMETLSCALCLPLISTYADSDTRFEQQVACLPPTSTALTLLSPHFRSHCLTRSRC